MSVETLLQIAYRIDRHDRITSVSPEWDEFARSNGAAALDAEAVLGRPLAGFISGVETRHLWEGLFGLVRSGRCIVGVPYRCDSPEVRRLMEMTLNPLPDRGIELLSRCVREEPHSTIALLDPAAPRSHEFVKLCSWCKRMKRDEAHWDELEDACRDRGLLELRAQPKITHGICLDCLGRATEEF